MKLKGIHGISCLVILYMAFFTGVLNADAIDDSLSYAQEGDFEGAIVLIEPLAIAGNAEAQWWLAKFYLDGLNNAEEGKKWLDKAAHNGNGDAQYAIAWNLSAGWIDDPIERIVQVIYWFEKAGFNGRVDAYANLAVLYDKEHRDVMAEMEELANKGHAMAQYNMGWIYGRGLLSEEGLLQDLKIAEYWFSRSAELGFQDAKDHLKKNFTSE